MNYSYKGKILISTPDVSGDIFSRSVVLIIDHNENGAFGLILNKNSNKAFNISGKKVAAYEGGPVETEKAFVIVKGEPLNEFSMEISPNYYITEDIQSVTTSIEKKQFDINDFRVFLGYSGWAAQQLESEIHKKFWTVVDVYNLDYTLPNNQNLWKNIMQNLGGEFLIWANAPEDVSLN